MNATNEAEVVIDDENEETTMAEDLGIVYVNCYLVDRLYGGPEEGGWWYDSGAPLASVPVKAKKNDNGYMEPIDSVEKIRDDLKEMFAPLANERDRNSVIGGPDVEAYVEDHPAEAFPATRPRYE
jgi:hypothetical protein